MWTLVTALLLVCPALAQYRDLYNNQEPEDVEFEITANVRRSTAEIVCPRQAVCGVVFDFNRTRFGVTRPERRIIHNCRCPDGGECPIQAEHRVFSSIKRREYLCQPTSTLQMCQPRRFASPGRRVNWVPAKELVVGSEEFNYVPYNRVNCLCPLHTNPIIPRRRSMALATVIHTVQFDIDRNMSFHRRKCVWPRIHRNRRRNE